MRVLLASFALLSISSFALAQPAKTPEHLLSADCLAYFRYDGYEPHKKAYEQTALAKAMKEGLGEFFDHAFAQIATLSGGDFPPRKLNPKQAPGLDVDGMLDCISKNGFVLGLEVAPPGQAWVQGDDLYHLTFVFPNGAEKKNRQALDAFFRSLARLGEVPIEEVKAAGRVVQTAKYGETQIAWWAEDKHVVLAAGVRPFARTLRVIDGRKPNLTTATWHRDLAAFNRYETDMRGYVNLAGIVDRIAMYGLEEPGLESLKGRFERHVILSHLGLTGLKDLTFHLGFDGKFQRSTVRLGVVEPAKRAGLLRLMSGPIAYGLDKLPPLPPDADYVSVRHVDWAGVEDYLRTSYGLLAVSNLLKGDLPPRFPDLDRLVGGNFRKDFIEQLDTTIVCYGGHSEGPFFLGQGFAVKVKDAAKVKKGLQAITKALGDKEEMLRTEKKMYRGQEMHVFSNFFLPVTYTIHNDWLVFSLFPQPVQGFIMRSGGKYKTWKIPPEFDIALAKELLAGRASDGRKKSKLLGVSVSDPRPAIEIGLSLMPAFVQMMNQSMGMKFFDVDKIPNSQSINEWVFPNTAFLYDDGNALRWENHYSINEGDDFLLLMMSPAAAEFLDFIPFNLPARKPKAAAQMRGGGAEKIAQPPARLGDGMDAKQPALRQATAVEKDGTVQIMVLANKTVAEVEMRKAHYKETKVVRENGVNRSVTETKWKEVPYTKYKDVKVSIPLIEECTKVEVTRKDGKAVDLKELPKLLEKETEVLVVTGGGAIDPVILQRLDERTLIIRVSPAK